MVDLHYDLFGGRHVYRIVDEMKTADGFDSCLIGKDSKGRAIYDADAMIDVLMNMGDMDREDAEDFFWFNIDGAYVGEDTPVYVFLSYDR